MADTSVADAGSIASTDALAATATRHVWHHATQVAEYADTGPIVFVRGQGATLWDEQGREYLDGTAILGVSQIGHGRAEMAEAIAAQVRRLEYGSTANGFSNEPAARLATRLAALTPGELAVSYFASSGAEAVEAALKIARQYHANRGEPGRTTILARRGSYHGTTLGALSATGLPAFKTHFEPLLPWVRHVGQPYAYRSEEELGCPPDETGRRAAESLEAAIQKAGPETVAAFIAEPVAVPQAIKVPPTDYWPAVQDICRRYGILLIVDEVFTGFGRTGKLFASEHFGIRPDIMTVSKGLTSGYVPLSAAIATRQVFDAFWGEPELAFAHAGTYSGHPVACAAALANLDIIEREGLVARSAELGNLLLSGLRELAGRPFVGNVTGLGLLTSVELVADRSTKAPAPAEVGTFIRDHMLERGVVGRSMTGSFYFYPPLVATEGEVGRLVEALGTALDESGRRFNGAWRG